MKACHLQSKGEAEEAIRMMNEVIEKKMIFKEMNFGIRVFLVVHHA